jgi:hypothetical protein
MPAELRVIHDGYANADGPAEDPRATDLPALHDGRRRILELDPVTVVPDHGPAFHPDEHTPR